jgi:hypothetical protein
VPFATRAQSAQPPRAFVCLRKHRNRTSSVIPSLLLLGVEANGAAFLQTLPPFNVHSSQPFMIDPTRLHLPHYRSSDVALHWARVVQV